MKLNGGSASLVSVHVLLWLLGESESRRPRGRQGLSSPEGDIDGYCPPCDISHCPVVTAETCPGTIVKDWCNCCPICTNGVTGSTSSASQTSNTETMAIEQNDNVSSSSESPKPAPGQIEACGQIKCPKFQVCMLNIQGLPTCRCPNKFWCLKGERSPVCGQDNITYKSKCFLKMAECEIGKNISIQKKGKCHQSEMDRQIKLERQKHKEEKKQKRLEKKKRKQEKRDDKKLKKKKMKRRQRRQRRGKKSTRWTRNGSNLKYRYL